MCHLTLSWLLLSMLKYHLYDFSRPIRLFLGSFLWRLLLLAMLHPSSECFYECEHLHNRALVSVLATGRNSTNFLLLPNYQAWPLPLSMTWTTKTSPATLFSHSLKMKRKPFSSSFSCLWQPKIIDWPNFVWQKIGQKGFFPLLHNGTHDKSQWAKHDRKWCMRFEYTKNMVDVVFCIKRIQL